mmetsp:Transcript_68351/g.142866  ORF Transcript_68351/g.142866 Transcript_68351/m.142866 type:complete len:259 (+) Transcript_68351:409-1185(+)
MTVVGSMRLFLTLLLLVVAADGSPGTAADPPVNATSLAQNLNASRQFSGPVWIVIGDCKIDPFDAECVASPNYPLASRDGASCTLKLQDERYLLPGDRSYAAGLGEAVYFMNFTDESGVIHEGRSVNASVFESSHENFTIKYHLDNFAYGHRGWRICARRAVEADSIAQTHSHQQPYHSWADSDAWEAAAPLVIVGFMVGVCVVQLFCASLWVGLAVRIKKHCGKRSKVTRELSVAKRSGTRQNSEAGLTANRDAAQV